MTTPHVVDLTSATKAILPHVVDNLARAEQFYETRTSFTTVQDFIWRHCHGRPEVLTAQVRAEATSLKDCYILHLAFVGGVGADDLRVNHRSAIVAATTATLEVNNWVLAKLRDDQEPEVMCNRDGLYFTLTRRLESEAPVDEQKPSDSTELAN